MQIASAYVNGPRGMSPWSVDRVFYRICRLPKKYCGDLQLYSVQTAAPIQSKAGIASAHLPDGLILEQNNSDGVDLLRSQSDYLDHKGVDLFVDRVALHSFQTADYPI